MSCRLVVIGASFVHVKTISSGTYESEDSMGRTSPTKQAGNCYSDTVHIDRDIERY